MSWYSKYYYEVNETVSYHFVRAGHRNPSFQVQNYAGSIIFVHNRCYDILS